MTLARCQELLEADPEACGKFYRKIRRLVRKEEGLEHRDYIIQALLDGPKTATQAANWARTRGDNLMDTALARTICKHLSGEGKAEEKCDLFSATDKLREGVETPTVRQVRETKPLAPPVAAAPAPPAPPLRSHNTNDDWVAQCAQLPMENELHFPVPEGKNAHQHANNVRCTLYQRKATQQWRWTVLARGLNVVVRKVGLHAPSPSGPEVERAALIETPKSISLLGNECAGCEGEMPPDFSPVLDYRWPIRFGVKPFCTEACKQAYIAKYAPGYKPAPAPQSPIAFDVRPLLADLDAKIGMLADLRKTLADLYQVVA